MKSEKQVRQNIWSVPEGNPAKEKEIADGFGCSPVLARLLWNRKVRTAEEANKFLNLRLSDLEPPDRFAAMAQAVAKIRNALREKKKVAVFGDYDVDGISACAILKLFFDQLGAPVKVFLPDRLNEGYGMSHTGIEKMHRWGAQLVITVDNGVSCAEEIAHGRRLGMDFVVTDHHEPSDHLPQGVPIINPKLPEETYPFRELAGAGVAFKLAWGLAMHISGRRKVSEQFRRFLLKAIAFASLGTIADVVPLIGENRILTHHGLRILQEMEAPGLQALRKTACEGQALLKPHHVAFRLGPRLNAAGRLGNAERALELLTTEDNSRAEQLAQELSRENERRKRLEEDIIRLARSMVQNSEHSEAPCIVLADREWHVGVVGIAAARLAEEFGKPTVLISLDGAEGRGSGRTAGGVALHEVISKNSCFLERFGGHAEACGIRIKEDQIIPFTSGLQHTIRERYPVLQENFLCDMVLPPHKITNNILHELSRLAPFGEGNPAPTFVAQNVDKLGEVRCMGKNNNHASFMCRSGPYTFRTVYFGGIDEAERTDTQVTFAYEPSINTYMGITELELRIKKIF